MGMGTGIKVVSLGEQAWEERRNGWTDDCCVGFWRRGGTDRRGEDQYDWHQKGDDIQKFCREGEKRVTGNGFGLDSEVHPHGGDFLYSLPLVRSFRPPSTSSPSP